jgi:hypothetical protein
MKTNCPARRFSTLLAALGLAVWGVTPAFSQDVTYAARVSSTNTEAWDSPFYWIPNGGTAYGRSTGYSTAPQTPTRVGSYYHMASTMTVGEGFGLVHTLGTHRGYGCLSYIVMVTQTTLNSSTDLIMNVGSTNCEITEVYGATAEGGRTNTTAFQLAHSADRWCTVCYLSSRIGVTQPHIDFKYVSGTNSRSYADCVRFVEFCCDCCQPAPNLAIQPPVGTNLSYVTVTGQTNTDDRALYVYQKVGSTETLIGQLTSGIVLGNNLVPVTWQADSLGAQVVVTRVSALRVESCHVFQGCTVGSGDGLRICSLADGALRYTGGSGTRIILLQSSDPGLALSDWQRADTNLPTPGAFTLPTPGSVSPMFYRLKCE